MEFVLSADLDWASEACIEDFLEICGRFSVRPTLFVTHTSPSALASGADLAIHPNFAPGSSHGATVESVLDHCLGLVPGATCSRSHRFLDSPAIQAALSQRGFTYDSNSLRHLEAGLQPQRLESGLMRYSVFFEDDAHWSQPLSWRFDNHAAAFRAPGLKVLNFHPFLVALNLPDGAAYRRCKPLIPTLDAGAAQWLRHPGSGARTFLIECLSALRGESFVPLSSLAPATA